jgi:hypothetical protein
MCNLSDKNWNTAKHKRLPLGQKKPFVHSAKGYRDERGSAIAFRGN